MPNILITATDAGDPTGAHGQVETPFLQTQVPGYNYGGEDAIMSWGPFQVDQAGNVTTTGTVTSAGGGGSYEFTPESYGALRNGRIVEDGAMTSGSAVLTCATSTPFAAGDVGKYVLVWGVITSTNSEPGYLFATVTGYTSPSQVTLSASATITVTASGVLFGTDDTAAIQAAVNAATAYSMTGNGALAKVILSEGIYCSGAPATLGSGTGGGNAAITLPIVNAEVGVKAQVQIIGAGCSQLPHWTQPQPPQAGSIIAAMRNDGSLNTTYGPTSIIGGPVNGYGGGGGTFSNMHIRLQGFTILIPMSSNAYAGPDLYGLGQASVDEVSYLPLAVISTSTTWPALSTNAGGIYGTATYWPAYTFGLRMPADGNNAVADIGSFTSYFTQISLIGSEHTTFVNLRALFSQYGILPMTNTGGTVSHGITGLHYLAQQVTYPVGSVASGYFALDCAIGIVIARMDIESQAQLVSDAASLLYGEIGFNLISAVTGYIAVQYASGGGSTLQLKRIEAAPGPVASPQAAPANNTAWPNYYYRDAWITLSATAITAVSIDSTAQAVPSAATKYAFFLPAGHSYTPMYTGTLTHTVSLS